MTPLLILTTLSTTLLSLPSTHAKTPASVTDGCECPTHSFNKGGIFDDSVISMRDFIVYGCCLDGYDVLNGFVNHQIKCIWNANGQLDPPMKPIRCIGHAFPCPPLLVDGVWKEVWGCCVVRGAPGLTSQKEEIEAVISKISIGAPTTMQTSMLSRIGTVRLEDREVGHTQTGGVKCVDAGTYPAEAEGWKGTDTLDGKRVTACCKDGYVLAPYLSADNALQCASLGDPKNTYFPPSPTDCGKEQACHGHPRGCCANPPKQDLKVIRKPSRSTTVIKGMNLTSYPSIPTTNHTLHPIMNHTTPMKLDIDGAMCPDHYRSVGTAEFNGTDCLDRQVVYACCPMGCVLSHKLSPWKSLMCTCLNVYEPGHRIAPMPHMPIKCLGEAMVCDGYPRACCVAY